MTARLVDDLHQDRIDALVVDIEALAGVADVVYISPEAALERLKEFYREQGLTLDLGGAEITLYSSVEIALTDPTFASRVADSLAGRMLHIRDDAFAQLGDKNLAWWA